MPLMFVVRIAAGSPPQVRGKLFLNFCRNLDSGITPAGAGKTVTSLLRHNRLKDHPRRCGENRAI